MFHLSLSLSIVLLHTRHIEFPIPNRGASTIFHNLQTVSEGRHTCIYVVGWNRRFLLGFEIQKMVVTCAYFSKLITYSFFISPDYTNLQSVSILTVSLH